MALWREDDRLVITSEWLAAWFGLRLLKSRLLKKATQNRIYSPNELAAFCEYLGCYFLYIFHWMRNGGDATALKFSDSKKGYEEVIESTLYLLSEYAHVDLKLPRSVPLFKVLKEMWASEAILYTVHHTYRDHLHHSVDLCLMGLLLIESGLVGSSKTEDECNWVLAALLHDVGYGLNLNRLILNRLRFLEISPVLKGYLENLQKALKAHGATLCDEIQRWMPGHRIQEVDHGVVSAMFVSALNMASPDSVDSDWLDGIQPALKAIIRHNLPEASIDPLKEPLSFLLLLCDHLQEWDRPRVDRRFCYYLTSNLLRSRGHPLSTSTLIRYMRTNLYWKQDEMKWILPPDDDDLEFDLVFKDACAENFEPAMIWCGHSFDLQKVRQDQLPRRVRLNFVHPLSTELAELKERTELTEMHLFQDFVREKSEEAAFSGWLAAIQGKQGGLSYEYEKKAQEERFTITLERGLQPKQTSLIPFLPSDLYQRFLSWKKERIQMIKLRTLNQVDTYLTEKNNPGTNTAQKRKDNRSKASSVRG